VTEVLRRFLSHLGRVARPSERARTADNPGFQITVELERDELDGGWIAEVVDFPGCMSQGETEDEALDNVLEAFREVLSAQLAEKFAQHNHGPQERTGRHRETVQVPVPASL
jgi:antitoxin HicB